MYVSRLIIDRSHAGQGIGATLIDWAGVRGLDNWGAKWIRGRRVEDELGAPQVLQGTGFRALADTRVPGLLGLPVRGPVPEADGRRRPHRRSQVHELS